MKEAATMFYHEPTGFLVGDPDLAPFDNDNSFTTDEIETRLKSFILSASGWRKVFAADGDEESTLEEVHPADKLLAAHMADVFVRFLKEMSRKERPTVVIGCDTRYTGPAIAEVMIRVFLSAGISVRYLFITAAPEIMAYTKTSRDIDGFTYISASHNPIGHNGVKFGLGDGGVIGGDGAARLISLYKTSVRNEKVSADIVHRLRSVSPTEVEKVFIQSAAWKEEALLAYRNFSREVISGLPGGEEQERFFCGLKSKITDCPIGVLAELNGSARTLSIDKPFLEAAGIAVTVINGKPREITHEILPEGASLSLCKQELEALYWKDPRYLFGYVPDNDGDRGNIVFIDQRTGRAEALEAQEVFALCCLSESAGMVYNGKAGKPAAIVANGPTSLRIDRIAGSFGIEVHRGEVGEANAVYRAAELREEGKLVRILGEGSNGGNITHPSTVRDPINTLFAFIKLLTIRDGAGRKGFFHIWCEMSGQTEKYKPDYTFTDIVGTLPAFSTTPISEQRAKLAVKTPDYVQLKRNYERIFREEYEKRKEELKRSYGFCSWEILHYLGTKTLAGPLEEALEREAGGREAILERFQRGGFKVLFRDETGAPCGFLWMRGSGTEPVFRVLVDVAGNDGEKEKRLLRWHTEIIQKAESLPNP
jgi:phosphomannomutase